MAAAIDADPQQRQMLGLLLSRAARRLLLRRRIRSVLQLGLELGLPLRRWFARERSRAARIGLAGAVDAYDALHEPFGWPHRRRVDDAAGAAAPVARVVREHRDAAAAGADAATRRVAELELRYLLHITRSARCYEWAALIALALEDTAALQLLLDDAQQQHEQQQADAAGTATLLLQELDAVAAQRGAASSVQRCLVDAASRLLRRRNCFRVSFE